jgi:Cof subfamily protein (haloacid dehalogenase superfamily)
MGSYRAVDGANLMHQRMPAGVGAGSLRCLAATPAAARANNGSRPSVICSDMDGTLLPSGGFPRRVSARNAAALKAAMARGVRVVIATGKRPGPWLPPLRAALGFDDPGGVTLNAPSVMMNGLLVTDTDGTVAHKQLLPPEVIARVLAFGGQHGLATHAYLDDGRNVCAARDEWSARVEVFEEPELEAIGAEAFAALGAAHGLGVFKIVWWGEAGAVTAARPHIDRLVGRDATVVSSLEEALEMLPAGGSKAAGMAVALGLLGADAADVLALGDGENDLSMLAEVAAAGGIAVCMENGMPQVKAVASCVGPSNDADGVAEAVRHFVFGEDSAAFRPGAKL